MAITYAATGLTQANSAITGATSSAASTYSTTTLQTTVSFAALSGVIAGMRITAPAALNGAEVLTASATTITCYPGSPTAIASGTAFTFVDSDGVITTGAGVNVIPIGSAPNAQRLISLTGTSTQFNIGGTFTIDASHNRWAFIGSSSQIAFLINAGTLNIVGTNTNTTSGTALFGGQIALLPNSQAAASETLSTTIVNAGTLNMIGAGYYGNSPWLLDTTNRTSGGPGSTTNINNSIIRLGTAATGALNTIYADAYRGTSLTSRFTCNVVNSYFVDTFCKFLGVRTSSIFNGAKWYKTIPQTTTLLTNLDVAIGIAPLISSDTVGFNFVGPTFGLSGNTNSYYNTHIAIGNTAGNGSAPTAVRSTVYGYEIGVAPKIGKILDFPSCRPWIEGRKNLSLALKNANGTALSTSTAGSYMEDFNSNTGQLATVAILAISKGAGYTAGTYTSTTGAIGGGGTGGQVTIVIDAAGSVSDAYISAVGSGYSTTTASGIPVYIDNTSFVGAGNGTTQTYVTVWPYQRYTRNTTGNTPDFSGNRVYYAETNGSGILNTTFTNSGNSGVSIALNNPVPPNGSAYTGVDFLIWAANASLPDYSGNPFGSSQALVPIDQRWSANGSTAYSITVPVRGYLYADNSYTLTEAIGGGATDVTSGTLFLSSDAYIVATAISAATAATYTDVVLSAYPPSTGPSNPTNALVTVSSGTLSAGTARNLDMVISKAKYDYTRVAGDKTAGFVARTGFGLGAFLTASGATSNATMAIGAWNASLTGKISKGSVFKSLSTTGAISLQGQAISTADNGIAASANTIYLGTSGTGASWTTTYTPTSTASSGALTLSGLAALVPGGQVTTNTVNTTNVASDNNIAIAAALQAVLPSGSTVYASSTALTNASFTLSLAADGGTTKFGGVGTITFDAVLTAVGFPATMQVYSALLPSTGAYAALAASAVATGFNESASRPAGWTAIANNSGSSIASTITFRGPSIWTGTPAPTFTDTVASPGARTASFGSYVNGVAASYSLAFALPAVLNGVTPAPTFTTSGAIAIGSAFSNGTITASTTSTLGSTIYQDLSVTNQFARLPTSGTIVNSATVGFGSSSISMTGDLTFTNATLTGMLTVTPGAAGRSLILNNCTISGLTLVNATPGTTIALVYQGTTIPFGSTPAGFVVNNTYVFTLPGTSISTLANLRSASLFLGSSTTPTDITSLATLTASGITFTYTTDPANAFKFAVFVDGFYPFFGSKAASATTAPAVNGGAAISSNQLDFTQRANFIAADTAFITGSTLVVTKTASLGTITISTPNDAYNQGNNAISRMVIRALMESASIAPTLHFEIASGTYFAASGAGYSTVNIYAGQAIDFTNIGSYIGNYTVSSAGGTTGWNVLYQKTSASNNVVALNLWNVGLEGNYQNVTTSNVTTNILFQGFSPGAVAQLTGAQLAAISLAAGSASNTALLPNLNALSNRINQASKLIPSSTTPLT